MGRMNMYEKINTYIHTYNRKNKNMHVKNMYVCINNVLKCLTLKEQQLNHI